MVVISFIILGEVDYIDHMTQSTLLKIKVSEIVWHRKNVYGDGAWKLNSYKNIVIFTLYTCMMNIGNNEYRK